MSRASQNWPGPRWAAALITALALAVGLGAAAQTTPPPVAPPIANEPAQNAAPGVDTAYFTGYNAGYAAGQDDHADDASANPHKFRAYQAADEGYTKAYGALADYQSAFRSGFDDGYGDGFHGRARTVGKAAPAAAAAPSAATSSGAGGTPALPTAKPAAASPFKHAVGVGYREGYSAGEFDANRNAPYDFTDNTEYKLASAGYGETTGDFASYQTNFRTGFREGYDDGFHHRLYNSEIGIRTDISFGPGGPGLLPTNTEVARARPSGVYHNGLLLEEGTLIQMQLNNDITTKASRAGDSFTATVTVPVWIGATLAIPAGTTVKGTVAEVKRGGILHGGARLQLRYDTIAIPGRGEYALHAVTAGVGQGAAGDVVNGDEGNIEHPNQTGQNAKRVAAPAAAGAIVGAIFGGGRGAMRGGLFGGALGAAGVLVSRKRDLALRVGEPLALRLERPLELRPSTTVY